MTSIHKAKGSAIDSTLYEGGRGLTIVNSNAKIGRGWEIPNTVWVFQGLLADIVAQSKAEPKQCAQDIALDFTSHWRLLLLRVACYVVLFSFSQQVFFNKLRDFKKLLDLESGKNYEAFTTRP